MNEPPLPWMKAHDEMSDCDAIGIASGRVCWQLEMKRKCHLFFNA